MSDPIIIIGSGLAGYMLAKEFRKLDADTPLIIITHSDGNFYTKPMLSNALSKQQTATTLVMNSKAEMEAQLKATVYSSVSVEQIDTANKTVQFDGQTLAYRDCVLAVGADKIQPPLEGDAVSQMMSVNHLEEYADFRAWLADKKHIGMLGCGLVGCEFANDLLNTDYHVSVMAPDPYPLMKFVPEAVGQALQRALQAQGLTWHLGHFAKRIDQQDQQFVVSLDDREKVLVDGVMSATGLRPHLQLAKAAGLTVNQGIVVNRHLQTSAEHVYALGDCAEVDGLVMQYVAPLLQCARALAKNLCGEQQAVMYPVMPIVIKTPTCPIAAYPPADDQAGEWQVEADGDNVKALFYDNQQQLHGFALSGDCAKQRSVLAKQIQPPFERE